MSNTFDTAFKNDDCDNCELDLMDCYGLGYCRKMEEDNFKEELAVEAKEVATDMPLDCPCNICEDILRCNTVCHKFITFNDNYHSRNEKGSLGG